MKRNDWKIIIGSIAFTYLFYQQQVGINFLVFAILSSILLLLNKPEHIFKPSVILSFFGTILSAVFVYLYGTQLPIISFVLSLSLLSGFVFEPKGSLIITSILSFTNVLLSIPKMIISLFNQETREISKKNNFTKFFLLLIPLFISFIFFLLYRIANPNFLEFTKDINFDWISMPLLRFFILSFLLMYGILSHKALRYFMEKDLAKSNEIKTTTEAQHQESAIGKRLSIEYEIFIGASLLLMLNLLLAVVNGIDLIKLWPNPVLPENQESFSQYLHSGIQMLILSIVLAVAILMFFFRGYFNYLKDAKYLKILSYIWIAQNVVLLLSTALRNKMYVEAYGLSHKRIGVFIYLLLAIIGLCITAYKLLAKKNNTFLFRKNAWAFYLVLLIATPIAWDQIITHHNITWAKENNKKVDYAYLAQLSHTNIGEIIPMLQLPFDKLNHGTALSDDTSYYLNKKLLNFLAKSKNQNWQSACVSKQQNLRKILALNQDEKIHAIVLNDYKMSLNDLKILTNLKAIVVNNYNQEEYWSQLKNFPKLELLNTQNSYSNVLDSLPVLPQLKYLNLNNNNMYSIRRITDFPNLEYLNIQGNYIKDYSPLYALSKLKELHIDELGEIQQIELTAALPHTKIIYDQSSYNR